jgi:hypothetical protein
MRRPLLLLVCAALLTPWSAHAAQIFEDVGTFPTPLLEFDPSMRSTAMGGASGAVFWGQDPNYWSNPGLLGYYEGVHYDDALVDLGTFMIAGPGFTDEFQIREISRRVTLGYGGLGVSLAGRPFDGSGGLSIDFGSLRDEARSWSAGISLAKVAEALHRAPALAQHFDLAFGYSHKTLVEGVGLLDNQGALYDWGLLASAGTDFIIGDAQARIEAAYGYSSLNQGDENFSANQHHINSAALHVAAARLPEGFLGLPAWFRTGFDPLLSVGGDYDWDFMPWHSEHVETYGGELGLANVLFLRLGSSSPGRSSAKGFGVGLPFGKFGGARYDQAYRKGLEDVTYRAWRVWIDPFAIARAGR